MGEPGSDLKSYLLNLIFSGDNSAVGRLLLPRLYCLADIDAGPTPLPLSARYLDPSKAYLLDASFAQFMWIGNGCTPNIIEAITGAPELVPGPNGEVAASYAPAATPLGNQIRGLVEVLASEQQMSPQVSVFVKGTRSEGNFLQMFVEDQAQGTMSYVDFIAQLQNQVVLSRSM